MASVRAPVCRIAVLPTPVAPGERFAPEEATLTDPPIVPLPPRVVPLLFTLTVPVANDWLPFTNSKPALTVVAPVYVFAPVKVQAPAPLLVSVPVVVPMMLVTEPFSAPVRVNPNPLPVIGPLFVRFRVPLLEEIVE